MSHRMNRRRFIQTASASSVGALAAGSLAAEGRDAANPASVSTLPDSGGVARKLWIDPGMAAWPPGPWRKVHIEYHSSRHIPRLGERFNADEFGDRLLAAHVN